MGRAYINKSKMKRRFFRGVIITPIRRTFTGTIKAPTIKAPSIFVGTDEVPEGEFQYERARKVAMEKSGLSRFDNWEFK